MFLSSEQIQRFHRDGFLHLPGLFNQDDFDPIKKALTQEINKRCVQLLADGEIQDAHADAPFEQRFGLIHAQCKDIQGAFDIDDLGFDAFFRQLSNPKLLDAIESLIGGNISINPIHHLRAKPPVHDENASPFFVPWHQDAGVVTKETDEHLIITAWYPLGDASKEMGCMTLIPGVPFGILLPHVASDYGTAIHPDFMPDTPRVLGECYEGDVILMSQWCPHHSTQNASNKCRWSMDTRYHVTGTPSGRDWYPSFPVRNQDANKIITDAQVWRDQWAQAKSQKNPGIVHRITELAVSK